MWNLDMSTAPKGEFKTTEHRTDKKVSKVVKFIPVKILLATVNSETGEKWTGVSHWIPEAKNGEGNRWCFIGKNSKPVAWAQWPVAHPMETANV